MHIEKINHLMTQLRARVLDLDALKPEVFYAKTFPLDFDRAVHYIGVNIVRDGRPETLMAWESPLGSLRVFHMQPEQVH
jgi:hypothetical protein